MGVSRGSCELGGSSRVCRLLRRRRQPYSTRGRGEDRDRVGQQSHKDLHAWTGYPGLGRLPVVHGPSRPGQPLGGVGIYPAGWELAQARPAAVRAIPDLSGEQIQRATRCLQRSDDGERRPAYRRQQWPDPAGYASPPTLRAPPSTSRRVTKNNSPPRPKLGGLRLHDQGLPATGCERGRTTGKWPAISSGQRRWCGLIMLAWPGPSVQLLRPAPRNCVV